MSDMIYFFAKLPKKRICSLFYANEVPVNSIF
jgi:hypothetical protein